MNPELPAELEEIINKALEKDRNLRYQHAADMRADLQRLKRDTDTGRVAAAAREQRRWGAEWVAPAVVPAIPSSGSPPAVVRQRVALQLAAGSHGDWGKETLESACPGRHRTRRGPRCRWPLSALATGNRRDQADQLTEKDTIVLADFDNTTGDDVFDEH